MAYSLQLKNARNSLALKAISGQCSNSDEFVEVLNEAMRRLNRRGNFFNTEELMEFCVYNGCITWPRIVGTVLGVRPCGRQSLELRNMWYNIVGPRGDGYGHNLGYGFRSSWTMKDAGTAPVYNDIMGESGKYIRVYPTKIEDVGKTISFFGTDANGQPLQEKVGNIWRRGITLKLQAPFIQSTMLVRRISAVTKDITQANVLVYQVDPDTGDQIDMALYEPSETNPNYRRSIIEGFRHMDGPRDEVNGVRWKKVECLVKLQYVDVYADEDFLPIDCLDAIKFMIQSIRYDEAGDAQNAEVFKLKAIQELNFQLRDKFPGDQTSVRINPIGRRLANPL